MSAVERVLGELAGLAVETQPQKVKRRSRDFYWYSPILKRQLDQVTADAVVTPQGEAEVVRTVAACHRHRVPRHRARRRHRQLWPGHAAAGRHRARSVRADRGQGDRPRPGARRGRDQARRARRRDHRRQPPGAAAPSQHPQDRHARRLHRRRQLGHRLDHLGAPARPRQHPGGPRRHHGGSSRASSSCAAPTSRRSTTPTAPTASSPSSRCRWRLPIAGRSCWSRCPT